MDKDKLVYRNSYTIYPKDSDYKKDIRPGALVNYFIQSAWLHAEELGFGYSHLSASGVGWVLSRFRIFIDELPGWPGEFILETWPKGIDRILYLRDAEIFNADSRRVAYLTSSWLVIDMESKRPRRSLPQADSFTGMSTRDAIKEPAIALSISGEPAYSERYKVKYNDIDVNLHLTTYRYIDLMFDTYDLEFLSRNKPCEISVNFVKEIPFGAELLINRYENAGSDMFELINTSENLVCFKGEIHFKNF